MSAERNIESDTRFGPPQYRTTETEGQPDMKFRIGTANSSPQSDRHKQPVDIFADPIRPQDEAWAVRHLAEAAGLSPDVPQIKSFDPTDKKN